jgi:23S rRNA (pseudouridine1915-N3)-methyltransferase
MSLKNYGAILDLKLQIVNIGHKLNGWQKEGYDDYIKRLPYSVELIELNPNKKHDLSPYFTKNHVIALDRLGKHVSSLDMAQYLNQSHIQSQKIIFLIGEADGIDKETLAKANQVWSLSALTFPHQLTKVMLAEQLYRSHSIHARHPYHR